MQNTNAALELLDLPQAAADTGINKKKNPITALAAIVKKAVMSVLKTPVFGVDTRLKGFTLENLNDPQVLAWLKEGYKNHEEFTVAINKRKLELQNGTDEEQQVTPQKKGRPQLKVIQGGKAAKKRAA